MKIYDLLKNINVSIPKIIEKNNNDFIIVSEDFGNLRFDKILNKNNVKDLLQFSVDTLIEIKNNISYDIKLNLNQYNFNLFKKEIMELVDFYFPYVGITDKGLIDNFLSIWTEAFYKIHFNFESFVHKDFNINNLILVPSKRNFLKCGVIDFQSAFWGESCWDLFSLLEDSRVAFTDEFNDYFIEYFYTKTNNTNSLEDFKIKFNFLNASRQTRLLGRWIKLSKEVHNKWYLQFLPITKKRLIKSLNLINNKDLNNFYINQKIL